LLEAGRLREARAQFWRDAEEAERSGDVEALATAALGLGGMWVHEHRNTLDQARVRDLQLRALGQLERGTPLAYRLSARLAAEHAYLTGDGTAIFAALSAAATHTDPLWRADVLSLAHHCLLGPEFADLRLSLADELISISPITGRPLDGLMGLAWRTIDLLLAGDHRATRSLGQLRERLDTERCDALSHLVRALDVTLAIRAGRLDEAERLAEECYRLGLDVGDADAFGWYGAQLLAIRWLQGRSDELLPLMRDLASSPSVAELNSGFQVAIAVLGAADGDRAATRAALASMRSGGLDALPPSSVWLATMLGVCEAAHVLGDADAAAEAYALLGPFADRPVMASLGVAPYGSAHRPLGLAALTMGDVDAAVDHFEAAAVADLALGDSPWHAVDLAALADALDRRDGPGDRERATASRRSAVEGARRSGMTRRADQWARPRRSDGSASAVSFRREGRYWHVRLGGRAVVVPHNVGMEYLAQLVERPGVGIAAVELASRHTLRYRGGSEPVLDERAKAAYRRSIEELRSEVDDAEACADLERAARARADLDRFLEELARATGFGGRSRSFVGNAERARTSVNKAIKRALATISEADPALGREIGSKVVTGMRCVYLATTTP
jgi:tetratricopeptide (TPR) repeat protein